MDMSKFNISKIAEETAERFKSLFGGSRVESEKRGKSKSSLVTTLSISFFAFLLIMLIVLWLFQTVFLESFYKAIKTKNITVCAQSIIENIDNENIEVLLDAIGKQNDTCIMLCKPDVYGNYQKVHSISVNPLCTIHSLGSKELNSYYISAKNNDGTIINVVECPDYDGVYFQNSSEDSEEDNSGSDADYSFNGAMPVFEKSGAESLVYISAFSDSGGKEYMLLLESVVTPIRSTVETLRYQLRIITFVFIIISIGLTVYVSRIIARPIESINRSAKELAEGNYDVEFRGSGYKEVEQLSDTLNYAASELSQVDQMRKDLIANVSHDLRTPLTLITGYGEVMRDIPGENTAENIQIIIDEATRLSSLVNDLIDISKIEAGTMKLEAKTFCITDSIKEMFGRYNKLKEQDGYSFDFEHDCDVYVYADELKISQVIYNLVNNAVNYCGENKSIVVRQICYDNRVRIEVVDSGPGIPPEKLKNIWDRYYKVDKSHRSAKIGTGLGLSIVKSVLKLHRAQFGVFSTLGKGTTFWFELYRTNKDGEPL